MSFGAVMGGIGGLVNLLSPLFTSGQQPDQINPLTDQRLADLQAMLGQYQPQFNNLGGQAQSLRGRQAGAAQEGQRLAEQSANVKGPSANAWFDQFLENIPEYQAISADVSRISQEVLGRDIREQANRDMEQAVRAAGDATAGQGFSGAAAAATGQAAGNVMGQAGLARQQLASDTFNNTFGSLAGQGQNIAFQDQQMQFNNALQSLGQAMQGQFGASNAFGGAASNAVGAQANLGSLINMLQGNIQDITQPVYSSPTYTNRFAGAGNSIAAIGEAYDAFSADKDLGKGETLEEEGPE